jgi:hypothetical protein
MKYLKIFEDFSYNPGEYHLIKLDIKVSKRIQGKII